MTVSLSLSPEKESRLRQQAAAAGKDLAAFVQEAVEEKLASGDHDTKPHLTPEEWEAEFNAWISSHRPVSQFVDDSRESIYAGRGE